MTSHWSGKSDGGLKTGQQMVDKNYGDLERGQIGEEKLWGGS